MMNMVLCADDYAISPAVSQGVLEALSAGRLTAVGCMTNRPFWREGAKALAPFRGKADLGLHLTLTLGAPLGPMPAFAPHQRFPELRSLLAQARTGTLPLQEIRAEIDRQLEAFVAELGAPPDFLDGHQHVHILPGLRGLVLDALAARGWAGRVWRRDCADRPLSILRRRVELKKAAFVTFLARGFAAQAAAKGFSCNTGFAGFSSFDPKRDYARDFRSYLVAPGPRHLVMCHPGHADRALAEVDPHTTSRENELSFLLSQDFLDTLHRAGLGLRRFGAI